MPTRRDALAALAAVALCPADALNVPNATPPADLVVERAEIRRWFERAKSRLQAIVDKAAVDWTDCPDVVEGLQKLRDHMDVCLEGLAMQARAWDPHWDEPSE